VPLTLFSPRAALLALAVIGSLTIPHAAQADLIHEYNFKGNFNDNFGGPALVAGGAGTFSAQDYNFGKNQGLSLTGGLPSTGSYSIATDFSFTDTAGYRKIIDFKNLSNDNGLYNLSGRTMFYGGGESAINSFSPNTPVRFVITRDASTNLFTSYVNGSQVLQFNDVNGVSLFGSNPLNFFYDDNGTGGNESSAGSVSHLAVYDNTLSAGEVAALGAIATPEPETWAMMAMGLVALSIAFRRKQSQQHDSIPASQRCGAGGALG
jgi:hypothetical protein